MLREKISFVRVVCAQEDTASRAVIFSGLPFPWLRRVTLLNAFVPTYGLYIYLQGKVCVIHHV